MILVINCGSSSAKYQLFDIRGWKTLAKGIVERIGDKNQAVKTHRHAMKVIMDTLTDPKSGVLTGVDKIKGTGHRVVHGAEEFKQSVIITRKVVKSIEKYTALAPLHNPPSVEGIKECLELMPGIPQVAVFDTAFHQTIPPQAFVYGLPYEFYTKYGIRRYGFHGTSHRYVSEEASKILKRPLGRLRLITCHLGNGCSMAAVDRGKSIDTTMGFTPLEGLLMGTRAGDMDAAIVLHILDQRGMNPRAVSEILNKRSGLAGVSGISNDMRDLVKAGRAGNKRARLAIDIFVYRIKKYIGAYQAVMGGLDAVIFTAGIGENHPWLIKRISRELNGVVGRGVRFISVPTNEELLIAKETHRLIDKRASDTN